MNGKLRLTTLIAVSALTLGFAAMSAQADNTQQSKMKTCNADATSQKLTGDARKSYMKTCLSSTPAPATPAAASTTSGNSQQQKMKTCNADATSQKLTGDARKSYMKTCLSGSSSSGASAAPTGAAPAAPASAPK